jgi:hypothetical protein
MEALSKEKTASFVSLNECRGGCLAHISISEPKISNMNRIGGSAGSVAFFNGRKRVLF